MQYKAYYTRPCLFAFLIMHFFCIIETFLSTFPSFRFACQVRCRNLRVNDSGQLCQKKQKYGGEIVSHKMTNEKSWKEGKAREKYQHVILRRNYALNPLLDILRLVQINRSSQIESQRVQLSKSSRQPYVSQCHGA